MILPQEWQFRLENVNFEISQNSDYLMRGRVIHWNLFISLHGHFRVSLPVFGQVGSMLATGIFNTDWQFETFLRISLNTWQWCVVHILHVLWKIENKCVLLLKKRILFFAKHFILGEIWLPNVDTRELRMEMTVLCCPVRRANLVTWKRPS